MFSLKSIVKGVFIGSCFMLINGANVVQASDFITYDNINNSKFLEHEYGSESSYSSGSTKALDYIQYINSDFTDGFTVKHSHMCGECRSANDLTVIADNGVPLKHKQIIDNLIINKIPKGVIDSFRYGGYKLLLTSKDIREFEGGDIPFEPSGVFSSYTKTLYLSNKYNNYWGETALVHEFGHYLDVATMDASGYTVRVSKTEEFKNIWSSEKANFKVDYLPNLSYYQSTSVEYFAQAFEEYVDNPSRLKRNTPKTYNYIEKCLRIIDMSVS